MKNYVVESYENYREEERLSTNNARRIEFLTTVRALDELIMGKKKILDCAAGTGVYAFYLADKGHDVTATDITPRHIEVIKEVVKDKPYEMDAKFEDVAQPINKGKVITVQTSMAISLVLLVSFQRTFSSMKVRIQKWICLI